MKKGRRKLYDGRVKLRHTRWFSGLVSVLLSGFFWFFCGLAEVVLFLVFIRNLKERGNGEGC